MRIAKIAQPALYEEVAERLRQRIFSHELRPGSWVDEQALAEEFGISRTPLREALKVLAAEGLVTLKPRRGCYVTELSDEDLDQIIDIVAMLEGRCALEATRRLGAGALQQLESLHDGLERAASRNDIDDFFEANQEFHRTLQQLTGNPWLLQVIQDLRKVMKLSRHHSLFREGRLMRSLEEHRAIMGAIRDRDPERAEAAMRAHLLAGRAAMGKPERQRVAG